MEQSLAMVTPRGMATYDINEAKHRYNALVEYVQKLMVEGRDFGKIPGSDKPTLLKPGAEKLRTFFGFRIPVELVDKTEDWDKGFFNYIYRCNAFEGDSLIASCEASANSKETKYRYRNIMEWEATDDDKKNAVKVVTKQKKSGNGSFKIYKLENTEPFDLVNTLQKMAQKRAIVGAVLLAANASEFFTQDIEDLEFVDAEFEEVKPAQKPVVTQPVQPAVTYPKPVEASAPFTLEECESMTTSDGKRYGDLTNTEILNRLNAMCKAKNPDNDRLLKIDKTKFLLAARNRGESKEPATLLETAAQLGGTN
jgi:hypothetical protein